MPRFLTLVVGLALLGFVRAADDTKTELEGSWEIVSLQREGKALKTGANLRGTIQGNTLSVKAGDKVVAGGTFKLDPTRKPKNIDITYTEGEEKGKTYKAIYQISGDTLKFCRPGTPEGKRPTNFTSTAEDGNFLAEYKRAKP